MSKLFLDKTIKRNKNLVKAAFQFHNSGEIYPNSYVIDLDILLENAEIMKSEADKNNIELFFMTKQIGRNPWIAKKLMEMGYKGAVVVDFQEALVMMENNIPIAHCGHIGQIPKGVMEKVIEYGVEYITSYSLDKIHEINNVAKKLNKIQKIFLKVISDEDIKYPGQYGGLNLNELEGIAEEIVACSNVKLVGVTSFPCFIYNRENKEIISTENIKTLQKAKEILNNIAEINITEMNVPSLTCCETLEKIRKCGGTQGEPGHGLTGTIPINELEDAKEIPAMVYVTEISHNIYSKAYCYGGGFYPRGNLKNALVGKSLEESVKTKIGSIPLENIDYYLPLEEKFNIGDTVIMAFRTQIFVTRSTVVLVEGIQSGKGKIIGRYDSQGNLLKEHSYE